MKYEVRWRDMSGMGQWEGGSVGIKAHCGMGNERTEKE